MSYPELKEILYFFEAGFGVLLTLLAVHGMQSTDPAERTASVVLIAVGLLLMLFSCVTFLLKDEPDIWR